MTPRAAVLVVVFSPHELRRRGLEVALRMHPGIDVVAVTGDSTELSLLTEKHGADGLVADLEAATEGDVHALRAIAYTQGDSVAMVCFARGDNQRVGAVTDFAYVLDPRDGLNLVIAALQRDQSAALLRSHDTRREMVHLTQRETQILHELARGRSTAEAASELGISPKTVDVHKRNLYTKLHARSQAEAVAVALRRRILDPAALE